MSKRSGSADLPLHSGSVPSWLANRMTRMGVVIAEAIILEYGRNEFLRRLSHPFWFQSFGAVMGMDWHSSGLTTSVMGALKRGINPRAAELGLTICGGRGRHSRATPAELLKAGERTGLNADDLSKTSRLVAKVDSAAVQDGFALYLHSFILADDGKWVVVQQGKNDDQHLARRYHWLSEELKGFLDSPHAAIDGVAMGEIVNLADVRAAASRADQMDLLRTIGPDGIVDTLAAKEGRGITKLEPQLTLPHLIMPSRDDVRAQDIVLRRLHGALAAAVECAPRDFEELLLTPGVGARSVFSLALAAEVIHGSPCRFSDPARYSLAHGGKDHNPYPVPTKVYDKTIQVLKSAVAQARLGNSEELAAIKRLDLQARILERTAEGPTFQAFIAKEKARSHEYGGRSVFGWEPAPAPAQAPPEALQKSAS